MSLGTQDQIKYPDSVGIAADLMFIVDSVAAYLADCLLLYDQIVIPASHFSITRLYSEFIPSQLDRNFLGNIDSDGKRDALKALIKPTEAERQLYSDIGRYYDMYINHTMGITEKCVRSDFTVQVKASIDQATGRVRIKQLMSYRLHPTINGYHDINVEIDDLNQDSIITNVIVTTPQGQRVYNQKPEVVKVAFDGREGGRATIPLTKLGVGHAHLKIEIDLTEYGYDHWALLTFRALQPTDGFRYNILCLNDLKVVAQRAFVHGAKLYFDSNEAETEMVFSSDEWFNEGTGLSVVISTNKTSEPSNSADAKGHTAD